MRAFSWHSLLPVALLFLAATVSAQKVGGSWDTFGRLDGGLNGLPDYLGRAMSDVGDLDRDGFVDFSSPSNQFGVNSGVLSVLSGRDGSLVRQFTGPSGVGFGHAAAGVGDVDQDLTNDLVISAPYAAGDRGMIYLYSGRTGSLIRTWVGDPTPLAFYLGHRLANAGDVDGDGLQDFITGSFSADRARVYSAATGAMLHEFFGTFGPNSFGDGVFGGMDCNGDGVPDLLVGDRSADPNGISNAGSVYLYSGRTGLLLRQWDGRKINQSLGAASLSDDMDGDQMADVLLGSKQGAYLYSGTSGTLIRHFSQATGGVLAGGDLDGDGGMDILHADPSADPGGAAGAGMVEAYSGANGDLIFRFWGTQGGPPNFGSFGTSILFLGDRNGDRIQDVAVGAEYERWGGGLGAIHLFELDPYLLTDSASLSTSTGSTVPLRLDFPATEAGHGYAVLVSATGNGPTIHRGLEIPLTPDSIFTRMLGGWSPGLLRNSRGTLDANGDARAEFLSSPALAPYVGHTFYVAAISYDQATLTGRLSSIARYLTIVP